MSLNRSIAGTKAQISFPAAHLSLGSRLSRFFNRRIYIFLILPCFFFYTAFWILPMLMAIGISFLDWNGVSINSMQWVGLENYIRLFNDRFFWVSLKNNFILVGGTVVIGCLMALIFALLLDAGLRGAGLFRTIFFMPTVFSMIVVGLLFTIVLSPSIGLLNPVLARLGFTTLAKIAWLGDKRTALLSIMAVYIWREFGFSMFLFLAGLQAIPRELLEAARIDGASPLQSILRVTLPLLREVTIVVVILAVNGALLVFDLIVVMTWGGPYHASEVLTTYMYVKAFNSGQMGYGTAIAEILFVIVVVLTIVQLRVTRAGTMEF